MCAASIDDVYTHCAGAANWAASKTKIKTAVTASAIGCTVPVTLTTQASAAPSESLLPTLLLGAVAVARLL